MAGAVHGNGEGRVGTAVGAVAAGLLLLAVFTFLMLRGVEPFVTWYYLVAWYPVLLAADGVVALMGAAGRKGEFLLISRPRHLVSVLFWSAVIWLFYELFNFRLQNWYYVNVPAERALRWVFTFIAFATVLPAVFLAERVLGGLGVARNTTWRPLRMTEGRLRKIQIVGFIFLVLVLVWPHWFFPLVWGATTLLVEPLVYRGDRDRSILGDLEKGRPGRILRLLIGGMAIGLLWELLNIRARAKWIYTVPGLEELKLFEMPVLGFFGFPPFALECFVLWQALVLLGAAVPRDPEPSIHSSPFRRLAGVTLAAVFSVAVLRGMENGRTWDSTRPTLESLPVPASALASAGVNDPFDLAGAEPMLLASAADIPPDSAAAWVQDARLATLRGIGSENAELLRSVGITTVGDLADAAPDSLIRALQRVSPRPVVPARVRVWVRAARAATDEG